jgi:hypothetical protein
MGKPRDIHASFIGLSGEYGEPLECWGWRRNSLGIALADGRFRKRISCSADCVYKPHRAWMCCGDDVREIEMSKD